MIKKKHITMLVKKKICIFAVGFNWKEVVFTPI